MAEYKRAFTLVSAVLAGAVFLGSCGADDNGDDAAQAPEETSEQEAAEHNEADVRFAQMMIPHHEQAVEMAELAETRAGEDVKELAREIEAAQGPEIEQMTRLLESWGEEPEHDMDDMGHEGMDGMEGMMSESQMAELEQAEGDSFDTMFLEMMIDHHQGAIIMANEELENGANPEAKELAQDIVEVQETEIEEMRAMLGDDESGDSAAGQEHGGH